MEWLTDRARIPEWVRERVREAPQRMMQSVHTAISTTNAADDKELRVHEDLVRLFQEVGHRKACRRDELLANANAGAGGTQAVGSEFFMFLVLEGEVHELYVQDDGTTAFVVHGEETILNDDSFLLGTPPATSLRAGDAASRAAHQAGVVVANGPATGISTGGAFESRKISMSNYSSYSRVSKIQGMDSAPARGSAADGGGRGAERKQTVLLALGYKQVLGRIAAEPERMRRFFVLLAADLCIRLDRCSTALRYASRWQGQANDSVQAEASAVEVVRAFELPQRAQPLHILASAPAVVSYEVDGQALAAWQQVDAQLYVLQTHICIERELFLGLKQRKTFPIADVFSVLDLRSGQQGGSYGTQWRDGRAAARVSIQMRSSSLTLTLLIDDFADVVHEVECARASAMDLSNLKGETGEVDDEDSRDGGARFERAAAAARRQSTWAGKSSSSAVVKRPNVQLPDEVHLPSAEEIAEQVMHVLPERQDSNSASEILTASDWEIILKGARYRRYTKGQRVIAAGKVTNGLLQVVRGSLRVELEQADRPENLSVGQLQPGEMLGVRTQLLGAVPTVYTVVCEAEEAILLHFTSEYLDFVFDANPALGAKFYCVLAMRQAAKLARLCQKDANQLEKVISDSKAIAPKGIEEITTSPAFFHILQRFAYQASGLPDQVPVVVDFMHDVFQLHGEANALMLRVMVDRLFGLHVASDAARPIECLSDQLRADITDLLKGLHKMEGKTLRHIFDVPLAECKKYVEDAAFKTFQQSQHYQYVLALKSKELTVPKVEYFKVLNLLGRGSFGEVVEVVKRDCGQMYAMKVQRKELLQQMFGEVWEHVVMTERNLLVNLRHPLLINLAYAFQSIDHLVLVMDLCPLGDMTPFGAPLESRSTAKSVRMPMECVKFVALEVAACLLYLHSRAVLFRDLKPENLLIDMSGHCRVVDFGAAKMGDPDSGQPPTSSEYTGTPIYMAPEVKLVDEIGTPYSVGVDWFSYGVLIYEFAEGRLPFGPEPKFMNCDEEFVSPKLRDENGNEVPHLFDFLSALLDWDPKSRLGGAGVAAHPYLKGADWELVGLARLKSPLLPIVAHRHAAWRIEP